MRTSRTSKTRRISALLLTTILAAGYAQGALAQVAGQGAPPPVRQPLDENGVDVARGSFVTDIAQVSIGGTQGLSYAISSDGVTTAFGTIELSGSTLIVTVDGRSDSFTIS